MFTPVMALMNKIEIELRNGIIHSLKLKKVPGRKALSATQAKHFKKFVKVFGDEIVQSWINFFVYHKKIVTKKIAGKI